MKSKLLLAAAAASLVVSANLFANEPVGITPDMMAVVVKHNGKTVKIMRNQDNKNTVNKAFAKTSRPCPPFCIQPAVLAPGVDTIAEVEVLGYLKKINNGNRNILVVDSRTADWARKGTIPGAINIPWTKLNPAKGATTEGIIKILTEEFGAKLKPGADILDVDEAIVNGTVGDVIDYRGAKTLVMFCNGMWCGQSPNNIKNLLKFGYPAEKIKWYRGGMQDWEILGLTTVPG
jgi:rhodanese-related sulfurtransferase